MNSFILSILFLQALVTLSSAKIPTNGTSPAKGTPKPTKPIDFLHKVECKGDLRKVVIYGQWELNLQECIQKKATEKIKKIMASCGSTAFNPKEAIDKAACKKVKQIVDKRRKCRLTKKILQGCPKYKLCMNKAEKFYQKRIKELMPKSIGKYI
ncbi:uncharacterized protein LOC141849546 [Brevipalpus obovatus]|uniref:uncharacterized protein LOC141849546 n=1 Tax=Brevipalpus obovatus TaxID=246614 RepID=UPI003D9F3B17